SMSTWIEDDSYSEVEIRGNFTFYYGIDPNTGTLDGISLLEDSILLLGADEDIDFHKLHETLK
ncbi:MAG: hypothetical protein PHP22_12335, partial [Oscillospiraceae bacterium]|nr:hypothetical protein [Oscillospiraceae bacterium]